MENLFWLTVGLTFRLALVTTLLLLFLGVPLAYGLAHWRSRWRPVVQAVISMPLVLPPTVLGFYLLLFFSPQRGLGHWLNKTLDLQLVFTFEGLVLGSVLYSLPFMVQPILSGFEHLPRELEEASYTLGKSRWTTFWRVLLPNLQPALLTGTILSFAHTVGEFGVVLMIGGNIPGQTKVASIAIYEEVEAMNYPLAHQYAGLLLVFTFVILLLVYGWSQRQRHALGL